MSSDLARRRHRLLQARRHHRVTTTTQAQAGGPAGGPPGVGGARGNRRFGEVLQSLGLSDDQKDQIRKIMADARTQAKSETDPDARRSTMRAAFAKVQDILTPAQRDAFKAKMQALRNSSPAPAQ